MITLIGVAGGQPPYRLVGDSIGVFFVAFLVCFATAPLMRWLAVRHDVVDRPDTDRKDHAEPVAYLGGVAVYLGWLGGVFFSDMGMLGELEAQPQWTEYLTLRAPLIFGATVIMLSGLIDDVYRISPRVKVGCQFLAAAALAWSSQNLGVQLVTDGLAVLGVSVPFLLAYTLGTMLIAAFVLGGCNSMNLIDGLDGLSSGVTAIIMFGFLFIATHTGATPPDAGMITFQIAICLATLGAVLGILPYNFNPANIFLGDAGSQLLGYLCMATALMFADVPGNGPMLVTAALIVYALPLTDMFLTISRRALQGSPLSKGDRGHLHHKVLAAVRFFLPSPNLSIKLAVTAMYFLAAVFALVGCSLVFLRWRYVAAVFLALFGFITVGAYKSGRRDTLQFQVGQVGVESAAVDDLPTHPGDG